MQGSANLNVMIKAARAAGRSLVKDFREVENLQVSSKGAGDFVSRADRAAEDIIKEQLMDARPNYGYLGEETGEMEGTDPTRRWIVDPLDGTTNFLHGMPHWAVSIALEHKGEIVSAVVFDPAKGELFFAEKGQGAWLGDQQRLRASGRTALIESVYATGIPWAASKYLPATLKDLGRLMPAVAGVRRWGGSLPRSGLCRCRSLRRLLGTRVEALGHRRRYPDRPRGRCHGPAPARRAKHARRRAPDLRQRRHLRQVRQDHPRPVLTPHFRLLLKLNKPRAGKRRFE